jgi:hypothetical protein
MIRLHRPGLILAGIAAALLNVAATVPASASSSVRGLAARGDSRRAGLPGMDDPGQAAYGSAVSNAFG